MGARREREAVKYIRPAVNYALSSLDSRWHLGNVVGVISVVLAICRRVVSVSVSVALDAEKRVGRARGTIATGR